MNRRDAATGSHCAASGPILGGVAGRMTSIAENPNKRFNVYDTF